MNVRRVPLVGFVLTTLLMLPGCGSDEPEALVLQLEVG